MERRVSLEPMAALMMRVSRAGTWETAAVTEESEVMSRVRNLVLGSSTDGGEEREVGRTTVLGVRESWVASSRPMPREAPMTAIVWDIMCDLVVFVM